MSKLWAGMASGTINQLADDFNSSISFDKRMFKEDITGSIAHAEMLCKCNIITKEEKDLIIRGLSDILQGIMNGELEIDMSCEDIHTFVEQLLTENIGEAGKKLHTARSRNDQVALDLRLNLRSEIDLITTFCTKLIAEICVQAENNKDTIMPGYTHLQRAQPITFAHQILSYAFMLLRDVDRLYDCRKRLNVSPIGSCALAGTTYETDREFEAKKLGFSSICLNSIDGVSDRDFAVELMSDISLIMMHLSRLSEELILWSSFEFGFIRLSDDYTTGSSIMPQKKNSDMAELVRGKTGRVYGDLFALLTTLKGIPLAYNKDMQEDKEGVFDACDTVKNCLQVMAGMIATMQVNADNMKSAAQRGFINATDLADYLVRKGMPFRTAYKISGGIVNDCMKNGFVLEDYPLEKYKEASELIDNDVYDAVNIENCVNRRISAGGTGKASVEAQIEYIKNNL